MQIAKAEVLTNESKRDRRGNRIYSEQRKRELVAEWRASGLTQRVFVEKQGLKYGTFTSWTSARRRPGQEAEVKRVAFQELVMPAAAPANLVHRPGSMEVVMPDGMVLRGGSAMELAALVRELRRA